jgi:hypothetical protein
MLFFKIINLTLTFHFAVSSDFIICAKVLLLSSALQTLLHAKTDKKQSFKRSVDNNVSIVYTHVKIYIRSYVRVYINHTHTYAFIYRHKFTVFLTRRGFPLDNESTSICSHVKPLS